MAMQNIKSTRDEPITSERCVESSTAFSVVQSRLVSSDGAEIDARQFRGNATVRPASKSIDFRFGEARDTHQVRLKLPVPVRANSMSFRCRLHGWSTIRYVALGYADGETFRHVKIANVLQGQWTELVVAHGDLAFGLQNEFIELEPQDITELRLYIRGTPGVEPASLELDRVMLWLEASSGEAAVHHTCDLLHRASQVSGAAVDAL